MPTLFDPRRAHWKPFWTAVLAWIFVSAGLAQGANPLHYLITNDDALFENSVSFFGIAANGTLSLKDQVFTGGVGIGGGFFGANRLLILNSGSNQCAFASDAASGDIAEININTLQLVGSAAGSLTDTGTTNGIGLAMNSRYLYASFTDSSTIGTFQIQPGCILSFVGDTSALGLQGGIVDGMAVHGNILVATFGDGSIQSFNISSGMPVSNGDEQNSTSYLKSAGAAYPNSIDITKDGHFAIFGDTSSSTTIEVSDISAGKLGKTVVYPLGVGINSSDILLSPDETLLYISNTQGDKITAAPFNSSTGKVSAGCASNNLKGYSSRWSYLAGLALDANSGPGSVVYVAEFASRSSIGTVKVTTSGGQCTLQEIPGSPVSDGNSAGLLSIGMFPPRNF